MAVTALQRPDFRTIATFWQRHLPALRALFQQVLGLCQRAGLVRLGHVALDGTKIRANASVAHPVRPDRDRRRGALTATRRVGPGLAAAFFAFGSLTGCAIVGPSLEQAAQHRAIKRYGYTPTPARDNQVLAAFHGLALAGGLDPAKVRVGFQRSRELKAVSVGKHHFLIATSILETGNPCLIWGIVAHEVAHDVLGHADRQVAASTSIGLVATAASFFLPGAGYLVQGAGWLGLRSYSRAQESDADAAAVGLLEKAGWPPWTFRYALEFVLDVYGDREGSWVDTHPLTSERIDKQARVDAGRVEELCGPAAVRDAQAEIARKRLAEPGTKRDDKHPHARREGNQPVESPASDPR